MATYYLSGTTAQRGDNGDGLTFENAKKTVNGTSAAGTYDTVWIYPDEYNEVLKASIYYRGAAESARLAIIDGNLIVGSLPNDAYFENFTVKNFAAGTLAISAMNYTIFTANSANPAARYLIQLSNSIASRYNLIHNNKKIATNTILFNNVNKIFEFNTFYNEQFLIDGAIGVADGFKYNIFADCTVEVNTITCLKYTIFYGDCYIKKTGEAGYTQVLTTTNLTDRACGAFTGCAVLPDKAGTIVNNGSGKIRVTTAGHGLVTGNYITVRYATTNASYKNKYCAVTKIDNNSFDISAISYVSNDSIRWNVPFFINEFQNNFNIRHDCQAAQFRYTPDGVNNMWIGYAPPQAFEFSLNAGNSTNITATGEVLTATNPANIGIAEFNRIENSKVSIWGGFDASFLTDFINGRSLDFANQIDYTTFYTEGQVVPQGFYLVSGAPITYNAIVYSVGDKVKILAAPNTFTGVGATIYKINEYAYNGFTYQAKFNKYDSNPANDSAWLTMNLFSTAPKVNYNNNNPDDTFLYGDGDALYNAGNGKSIIYKSAIFRVYFNPNSLKK